MSFVVVMVPSNGQNYSQDKSMNDLLNALFISPNVIGDENNDIADEMDNWNVRFQNIISLPETTQEERLVKYTSLNGLNRDFIATASVYAKTIISEYFLRDEMKSVKKKVKETGYAGGKKFVWRGILFKLANGDSELYKGNDEAAAKSMGHELKGGNSYFRCCSGIPELHVALQALIDYKGFRIHAQAVLPICAQTLLMGTSDASKTVHAKSNELTRIMRDAAKELNLREHFVQNKMLYAACDIEGHRGSDGKHYVIDLARTFPPESPDQAPHLWRRNDGAHLDDGSLDVTSNEIKTTDKMDCESTEVDSGGSAVPTVGEIVRVSLSISSHITPSTREGQVLEVDKNTVTLLLTSLEEDPLLSGTTDVLLAGGDMNSIGEDFIALDLEHSSCCLGDDMSAFTSNIPEVVTVPISDIIYELHENQNRGGESVDNLGNSANKSGSVSRSNGDYHLPALKDKLSIFWRLLRPEFVKHRGSQLLGTHAVAGRHINTETGDGREEGIRDLENENFVMLNNGVKGIDPKPPVPLIDLTRDCSVVSALSCGYDLGNVLHNDDSNTEILPNAGLPLKQPVVSRVLSQPNPVRQDSAPTLISRPMSYASCLSMGPNSMSIDKNEQRHITVNDSKDDTTIKLFRPTCSYDTGESLNPMSSGGCTTYVKDNNFLTEEFDDSEVVAATVKDDTKFDEDSIISCSTHWSQKTDNSVTPKLPPVTVIEQVINLEGSQCMRPALPPVPLSPDALSSFGVTDPLCMEYDTDVRDATEVLVEKLIPAMAVDLQVNGHPLRREGLSITEYMHRHGVNIRHMGLLRWHLFRLQRERGSDGTVSVDKRGVDSSDNGVSVIQAELLLECIARTLKNLLRHIQRQRTYTRRICSEEEMTTLVVDFFNMITAAHPAAASFWSMLVIPGIYNRFGTITLMPDEATSNTAANSNNGVQLPILFTDHISDGDIEMLLHRVCLRGGIQLHPECLEHLKDGPAKGFEFAVSDVVAIIPVVKHMHQVDLGEGLMLSLMGQEASSGTSSVNRCVPASAKQSQSVRMRLLALSVDKLHAALKAVPDDAITKQALADAYQGLAFTSLSNTVTPPVSKPSSAKDYPVVDQRKVQGKCRFKNITERGFELYRSLLRADEYTTCSKLSISPDEDILGVCLLISHKSPHMGKHSRRSGSGSWSSSDQLEILNIGDVKVGLECVSLRYFRMLVAYHSTLKTTHDEMICSIDSSSSSSEMKQRDKTIRNTQVGHAPCWRFFPLIVDEDHAEMAKELLEHEMILADRLPNRKYNYEHLYVDGKLPLHTSSDKISKFTLPTSSISEKLPNFSANIVLRVIPAVMNSMVLKFCDDAHDKGKISDSALVGFIRFHHMLLFKAREMPEVRMKANELVEQFVKNGMYRMKDSTPDIGRFLSHVLLSDRGWDETLRYVFLQETFRRQVMWLVKNGGREYSLLVLEDDDVSMYRLQTTFSKTVKSLRIIMFQVYFLQTIARATGAHAHSNPSGDCSPAPQQAAAVVLHLYNASLGRPTAAMRNDYKTQFEEIMGISNYGQYLARVGCEITPHQLTLMLRNAIRTSVPGDYGSIEHCFLVGKTTLEEIPGNNTPKGATSDSRFMTWDDFEKNLISKSDLQSRRMDLEKIWYRTSKSTSLSKLSQSKKKSGGQSRLSDGGKTLAMKNNGSRNGDSRRDEQNASSSDFSHSSSGTKNHGKYNTGARHSQRRKVGGVRGDDEGKGNYGVVGERTNKVFSGERQVKNPPGHGDVRARDKQSFHLKSHGNSRNKLNSPAVGGRYMPPESSCGDRQSHGRKSDRGAQKGSGEEDESGWQRVKSRGHPGDRKGFNDGRSNK